MMDGSTTISRASRTDLGQIVALLTAVNLPHDGVAEHLDGFLVARSRTGELVGCIELERYGRLGLLRSAAVIPRLQRSGLGSRLTQSLMAGAAAGGVEEIVLLTTTARDFFARRFGFAVVPRADYDQQLAASPEWRLPCCSSAVCMKLNLAE